MRNEYVQYMRTMVPVGRLSFPFNNPPDDNPLIPLAELLANNLSAQIKYLPRAGYNI